MNVVDGPGTLVHAWYAEAGAQFAVGDYFRREYGETIKNTTIGGRFGYASGKLGKTSIDASSTYWNAFISTPIPNTPIKAFFDYVGYVNRTSLSGQVWNESIIKGGVKIGGGQPMMPLPLLLGTNMTF